MALQAGYFSTGYDLLERTLEVLTRANAPADTLALVHTRLGLTAYHLCDSPLALQHWAQSQALAPSEEVAGWISEAQPMAETLVSLVVSTYNYARYLTEAVDSLFAQTYKNLELIVVDDCSTDNTAEVIELLKAKYRFEYIKTEKNGGPSVALNTGMARVRGNYAITFDADDIMLPDSVQSHIDNVRQHPSAIFSFGKMDLLMPDGSLKNEPSPPIEGEMFDFILCGNFILHGTVMFKTEAWRQTGGFNVNTTFQDSDMWLRLLHMGPVKAMDKVVAHYRRHDASASAESKRKTQYRSRMGVLNHWRDEPMYDLAWMHRWKYHDKTMQDETIEEMIAEGDSDAYLHYRFAKILSCRGDTAQALSYAKSGKDAVSIDSYVAPALYARYLDMLIAAGQPAQALAFCQSLVSQRSKFKTPDFCWAAGEFLLTNCNKTPGKAGLKMLSEAQAYYIQCLAIGEPSNLYFVLKGSGTALPAMQLGNIQVGLKRYEDALRYYAKACEYSYLPAFNAHTRTRRLMGKLTKFNGAMP